MKKILIIALLLTGFVYSQTEVFIVRNKIDTLRIDVNDLKSGLGGTLIAPTDLIVIGDTNRYFLAWSDNSSNEEGFYLSSSPDGASWETPFTVPANTTSYTYNLIGNGIERWFRVSAFLGGLETAKIVSEATTTLDLRDLTPPYNVYNLTATGGDKQISLAWSDSSSDASMYYIYKSTNIIPADVTPIDSTTAKTYTNSGLGYSEIWHYRVNSRDASYNYSEYSNDAFDTTDAQFVQGTTGSDNPPIFSVLFENNDLNEFTSTSGTNFNASTASKYSGNYGGEMFFDGATSTSYGISSYSYPDTTFISFRFKINTGVVSALTFKYFTIAEFRTASNYALRFHIKTDGSGIPYLWGAYYNDSTGTNAYTSSTDFSFDTWHLVEVKYKKDASVGGAEIWVDSTLNATLSKADRNTSANAITEIRFGSSYVSGAFSGGSVYLDNIYGDTTRLGSVDTATVITPDVTPPNTPTGFTATGRYDVTPTPNLSYVDCSWTDASSDEAKFYIYRGVKDVVGGNLSLLDSVDANVTIWRDNTIPLTDTLHFYEYGIRARDAAYNYTAMSNPLSLPAVSTRDSAYLPGKPAGVIDPGTTEGDAFFVSSLGNGGDGRSWANAWNPTAGWDSTATNPSGINWSIVQPGDTIYIDGGTSSITYSNPLTIGKSGTSGNYITITKGTSTGRNGTVILTSTVYASNKHYVKLSKLHFRGTTSSNRVTIEGGSTNITADSLDMILYGRGFQIQDNRGNIIVQNCRLVSSTASTSQTDGVYSQRNRVTVGAPYLPAVIVRNNYIEINNVSTGAHNDAVQSYLDGDPSEATRETYQMYNNICYQNRAENGNSSITMNNYGDGWFTYFNNVTVQPHSWVVALGGQNNSAGSTNEKVRIWNNTIIGGTVQTKNIFLNVMDATDSCSILNNILINDNAGVLGQLVNSSSATVLDWDYNIYYHNGKSYGAEVLWKDGSTKSLSGMQAIGYDTHSYATNPLLTNLLIQMGGLGDYTLQVGSPARNVGKNIQAQVEALGIEWKDITGKARDTTPDIGAYEY